MAVAVAITTWLGIALVAAPPASAATVLYQQTGTPYSGPDNTDTSNDSTDAESAADFVVPSGETWTLSSLVITAYNSTGVDLTSFRVRVYTDNAGLPGTVVADQIASGVGDAANNYYEETITLNPTIVLAPGTYWLSIVAIAPNTQWAWQMNSTVVGQPGVWRNPGNGFGSGCTDFTAVSTCHTSSSFGDFLFQLVGTSAASSSGGLCNGLTPTITGAGTINGTSGPDVILGSSGADDITGGGGNDTICAGDGDDIVHSGGGADRVDGGAGKDQIFGQAGNDVLSGGADNDTLKGQDGEDQLAGGQGNDKLAGGYGDDFLSGGDGNDHIFGNDGTDKANGAAGNDTMFGGAGADDLHGNAGEDSLDGGIGTDSCAGGGGTDTLAACES